MKKSIKKIEFAMQIPKYFFVNATILTILLGAFFMFYNIGEASINNDAQFWYTRTQNFMRAIRLQRWEDTFQNPKPGVTVMWLSGISLETFLFLYNRVYGFTPEIYSHATFYLVHFSVVAPLVIVTIISLIIFAKFLYNLFDEKIMFFSIVLLVSQPFYVGLARNFHADSTVTAFMLLSAICAIYYFLKSQKSYLALLSGVFGGLALLAKSAAIFLVPYIALITLSDLLVSKRAISHYGKFAIDWVFSFVVTFFVLFPAMWKLPIPVLSWIFIDEGLQLVQEGRDGINGFWYYFEPVGRILTPILLGAIPLGTYFLAKEFLKMNRSEKLKWFMVVSYVLFYFLQMSLVNQKMDRYLLPTLPFLALIGGLGVAKLAGAIKKLPIKVFAMGFFFLSFSIIAYYFPNYLLYPSIKGRDQFGCSLCSDIGKYFNSMEDPASLKIVSESNKLHRLQPFVYGQVFSQNEILPNGWTPEYFVKADHVELPTAYSNCKLEKNIDFKGYTYWNIYRCKD